MPIPISRRTRVARLIAGHGPRWQAPRRHIPLWSLLQVNKDLKTRVLPNNAFFDTDYILTRRDLDTVDQRFRAFDFSTAPNSNFVCSWHDYSTAPVDK